MLFDGSWTIGGPWVAYMQPMWYSPAMGIIDTLRKSIDEVGIKEVSRRSGISPSTISRIGSGQVTPGLEVAEKISKAIGFKLDLLPLVEGSEKSKLNVVLKTLRTLKPQLSNLGVKHIVVFGSVARQEDQPESDIDLYLDFGKIKPSAAKLLDAEGRILGAFPKTGVDIVSNLETPKGRRLKIQIDKDGQSAF